MKEKNDGITKSKSKGNGNLVSAIGLAAIILVGVFIYNYPSIRAVDAKRDAAKDTANLSMIERIKEAIPKTSACSATEPEYLAVTIREPESNLPAVIVINGKAFVVQFERSNWDNFKSAHKKDPDKSSYKQYLNLVSGLSVDMPPQTKDNSGCTE